MEKKQNFPRKSVLVLELSSHCAVQLIQRKLKLLVPSSLQSTHSTYQQRGSIKWTRVIPAADILHQSCRMWRWRHTLTTRVLPKIPTASSRQEFCCGRERIISRNSSTHSPLCGRHRDFLLSLAERSKKRLFSILRRRSSSSSRRQRTRKNSPPVIQPLLWGFFLSLLSSFCSGTPPSLSASSFFPPLASVLRYWHHRRH